MKKLFLSSYFSNTSVLILPFLPKPPNEMRVAFIPTAADPYTDKSWMLEDRNKLLDLGFKIYDVDIKNKNPDLLYEELDKADAVFVSGGNTYYLLEKTLQSGFDKVIKQLINKGVVYIGSSAGSVLTCPTIEFIEDLDDRSIAKLETYNGLGLIDFLILPHYGEEKYLEKFNKIKNKWKNKGYKIIPITNNEVVVVNDDKYEIVKK